LCRKGCTRMAPEAETTTNPENLTEVKAFAFDLDGTIYLSGTPLPGSLELLAFLRERNVPYLFMTNNSSVSGETYMEKLAAIGLTPSRDQLLTSNDVAVHRLQELGISRAYLVASDEVRSVYEAAGIQHDDLNP